MNTKTFFSPENPNFFSLTHKKKFSLLKLSLKNSFIRFRGWKMFSSEKNSVSYMKKYITWKNVGFTYEKENPEQKDILLNNKPLFHTFKKILLTFSSCFHRWKQQQKPIKIMVSNLFSPPEQMFSPQGFRSYDLYGF